MPLYEFECEKGHLTEQYRRMADFTREITCDCGLLASLVVPRTVQVSVFQPYTEHHMAREPIKIESRKQRDALCEKLGVTYDTGKYVRKPRETAAVDSITYGDVKKALDEKN